MTVSQLRIKYSQKKKQIISRLNQFESILEKGSNKDIFKELCFCLLTPQSNAEMCGKTIEGLVKSKVLFEGGEKEIRKYLSKGVRFGTCKIPGQNKAYYIRMARKYQNNIGGIVRACNVYSAREWLVKNIKGMGYKEASHFLRNIGLGGNIAILDRHILKNIKALGVIKKLPETLSRGKYLDIEKKFINLSIKIKIPVSHLDLLFWSEETGIIYK